MIDETQLYLLSEAAEILRISSTTLYQLLRSGEISCYKTRGKYLIPGSALLEYLRQNPGYNSKE